MSPSGKKKNAKLPPLKNGKLHGIYREWHPNRQLSQQGEYKNGEKHGRWKKWDSLGKLIKVRSWKNGRFTEKRKPRSIPSYQEKLREEERKLKPKEKVEPQPTDQTDQEEAKRYSGGRPSNPISRPKEKVAPRPPTLSLRKQSSGPVDALTQKTIKWASDVLGYELDEQQADAVKGSPGNILVTARAGSGKTRVLTARALWLQLECGVSPEQLLLVTFGVDAADEMRMRLKPHVDKEMPHVMTFDSLSWNLVKPELPPLTDDIANSQRHLSKALVDMIRRRSGRKKTFARYIGELVEHEKVRDKFLDLIRLPWKKLWDDEENDWKMTDDFTLKGDKVCLAGDYVKSHGETVIANLLFMNGIKYKYEHPLKVMWDENQQEEGIYQPDFRIRHSEANESGVIIEYFGMTGIPAYDEQSKKKRQYWGDQPNWDLIEILPGDLGSRTEEAFERFLLEQLAKKNVHVQKKLTSKEILEKVPPEVTVGRWVKPLGSFIMRCRNDRITSSQLVSSIKAHDTKKDEEEKGFLSVVAEVYPLYLEKIDVEFVDYKGVMWQAVENIENGKTDWTRAAGKEKGDLKDIRYILIDEFQDLNPPFYALIKAIQKINSKVLVFAVGDDWQAIYGFTQASPKYFKQFDTLFSDSSAYVLRNNYRSHSEIVSVSNALFPWEKDKHGVAVTKKTGQVRFWNLSDFDTRIFRPGPHRKYSDRLVGAAATLVEDQLKAGRNVVMLTRTNFVQNLKIKEFRERVLAYLSFPEAREKVEISTVHRYKGLENDAVVVLDVKDLNYPLIHPDWKYQKIFGDSENKVVKEEKRLFYVLLSRAIKSLDLITVPNEHGTISRFLKQINPGESYADWKTFSDEKLLEVQLSGCYHVKDILLARKYKFKDGENKKYWQKIVPERELKDFSILKKQPWFCDGVEIKVIDEKGKCVYKSRATGKPPWSPKKKRGV
jgi:DNA helicase-4